MLEYNKTIRFPLEPEISDDLFKVQMDLGDRAQLLTSEITGTEVLVDFELCNESSKNVIGYLLEVIDYDEDFIGVIGTSPFGYQHPKYPNYTEDDGFLIYDLIKKGKQEIIKMEYEDGSIGEVYRDAGLELFLGDDKVTCWLYERKEENGYPVYFTVIAFKDKIKIYEGMKLSSFNIETI